MVAPSIWKQQRPLDQIVTVDLVSMSDGLPDAPAGPPAAAAPPPPPTPPKVTAEPKVSITPAETPPPPREAAPEAKPVSLEPIKRKKQKAEDTRLVEEREKEQQDKKKKEAEEQARQLAEKNKKEAEKKQQEEANRKRQLAEQAKLEAERAKKEAEQARALADQARRDAGRAKLDALRGDLRSGGGGGGSRGSSQLSLIEQQYFAALIQHIRPFWDLPEMKAWPKDTEAVVAVTIAADGKVLKIDFERKSKEAVYDQYVMQALRKASPMPAFPAAMQRKDVEVGLRFKPGDLGSM
jgi:colicin import membrane protein